MRDKSKLTNQQLLDYSIYTFFFISFFVIVGSQTWIVCNWSCGNLVQVQSTIFDSFPAVIFAFRGPKINLDWIDIYPEHLATNIFREFTCCLVSLSQRMCCHQPRKNGGCPCNIKDVVCCLQLDWRKFSLIYVFLGDNYQGKEDKKYCGLVSKRASRSCFLLRIFVSTTRYNLFKIIQSDIA